MSQDQVQEVQVGTEEPIGDEVTGGNGGPNWPLIGLVALAVVAILVAAWALATRRPTETVEIPVTVEVEKVVEKPVVETVVVEKEVPVTVEVEKEVAGGAGGDTCGAAEQLGPWAPDGRPEDFEVDANYGVVHASLWFPGLSPADTEYSVVLNGVRIRVIGGGTAWQWACHDVAFAQADAVKHGQRRQAAGKVTVLVTLDQLIAMYPGNVKHLTP